MSDTVQQIKDKLTIQDVAAGYVKLERAGSTLRARCPFHSERTPSFYVSNERGTYHCFGCGVHGDIFTFIEAIEGVDFKGALKMLAERAGVPLVFGPAEKRDDKDRLYDLLEVATVYFQAHLDDAAKAYLKKRGVEDGTILAFRLGYVGDGWSDLCEHLQKKGFTEKELIDAGVAKRGDRGGISDKFRNRIMFPLADTAGRIVAFSGRSFGEKAHPDAPKYLNSPETALFHKSRVLYGFDRAKQSMRKHGFAILVEGQMDLVMSHQAGFGNTVAVSGTAFTADHALLIKRMCENLLIALDADEAGIKAAGRAARVALASGLNVKVAAIPKDLDPADLILAEGGDAWRLIVRDAKDIITFLLDVLAIHAPKRDQYRRVVEAVVLPFLTDVQSPIAREQYVHEIAGRLGASEAAVHEAAKNVPRGIEGSSMRSPEAALQTEGESTAHSQRVRHAFAILLSQEAATQPEIDCAALAHDIGEIIGEERYQALRALSAQESESLRFEAERMNVTSSDLKHRIEALLAALRHDRLQEDLKRATEDLKRAEAVGDEAGAMALMERCRQLSADIARLRGKV